MGYTHCWSFQKIKRGTTTQVNAAYSKALKDCHKVIQAYSKQFAGLAGYSAHTKLKEYSGIQVNGSRENGHEDFVLGRDYKSNIGADFGGFCKTANKPYDVVVVACLIVLKHHLGENIAVGSDGNRADFVAGLHLAQTVLQDNSLQIPSTILAPQLRVVG